VKTPNAGGLALSAFGVNWFGAIFPCASSISPVSPLTPATFLIVELARVELGDHQRFSIPFLFGASVLMTLASVAFGVFPN
jgi:Mg2+/citrate symporter